MFLEAEPGEDSLTVPGVPGPSGPAGNAGAQGSAGHALFLEAEPGEDGLSLPGAPGPSGAASPPNIKQTEIDFGTTPVAEAEFIVADVDVSAGSQIIGSVAYEAPTGKDLDELEMDALDLKFGPGAGQLTIRARGLDGYLADKFRINYLVG